MSKSPPIPSQTCLVRWRAESSLALALDISGGVEKKNIPGRREHRRHHAWEVSLPAGKYYYSWVFFSGQGEKAQSRTPFPFSVGEADRRIEIDGGKIRREGREGRFLAAESQRTWPVPGQIGHRGDGAKASSSPQGRGKAKENTLASVRAAWEKGATAVEVDVQLHQGVIWVEHDDLGNPDPEGPPTPRLRLSELLRQAPPGLAFDLEIKFFPRDLGEVRPSRQDFSQSDSFKVIQLVSQVTQEISQAWPRRNLFLSSFDSRVCALALAMQKDYFVFLLAEGRGRGEVLRCLETAKLLKLQGAGIRGISLLGGSGEILEAAAEKGLTLVVWGEETNSAPVRKFLAQKEIPFVTDSLEPPADPLENKNPTRY